MAIASAYNLTLTDAVVTIDGGGTDDGSLTAAASSITTCIDSMTVSMQGTTVDVSCAQDLSEWHRIVKRGFSISMTKKTGNAEYATTDPGGLLLESWDSSPTNSLFRITLNIGGKTLTFDTVLENFDLNIDEPPTWSASFKAYGVAVGIA